MAAPKWLVTKRKRNRDIRDFISVHGKLIKPQQAVSLSHERASSSESETEEKRRQAPLPQFQERRKEERMKIPASFCSKGVRKKAPLTERRENCVSSDSTYTSIGSKTSTRLTGSVLEESEWREFCTSTCSSRVEKRLLPAVERKENAALDHHHSTPPGERRRVCANARDDVTICLLTRVLETPNPQRGGDDPVTSVTMTTASPSSYLRCSSTNLSEDGRHDYTQLIPSRSHDHQSESHDHQPESHEHQSRAHGHQSRSQDHQSIVHDNPSGSHDHQSRSHDHHFISHDPGYKTVPRTPAPRTDLNPHAYSSSPLLFDASSSESPHLDSPSLTLSWDTDALLAELASCERLCDEL